MEEVEMIKQKAKCITNDFLSHKSVLHLIMIYRANMFLLKLSYYLIFSSLYLAEMGFYICRTFLLKKRCVRCAYRIIVSLIGILL